MSAEASDPTPGAGAGGAGADPGAGGPGAEPGGTRGSGQPSEEELRAAYEAELSRITSIDVIAQAVVSLLNIGARRLGGPAEPRSAEGTGGAAGAGDGRDLDQVRDAVDAVRALLEVLERRIPAQELRSLRDALSQLQIAYAREVQAAGGPAGTASGGEPGGERGPGAQGGRAPGEGQGAPGEGPAVSSGRLWVPGR